MEATALWDLTVAGNTIANWTIAVGVAMLAAVVLRALVRWVARRTRKLAEGTTNLVDDLIADLVDRTSWVLLSAAGLWVGSYALSLSPRVAQTLRAVIVLAAITQAALWASAIADHLLQRQRRRFAESEPSLATTMGALRFVARVAVWGAAFLIALDTLGVDITTLIAGLGVGGIAVALAVQNILGDVFASASIVLDKPFVVGDFIVLGDSQGVVEHIGLKTTRIRALSGEELVIANSDLLSSRIQNFKRMRERRVSFDVGVVYGTASEKLRAIPDLVREAVESQENTRFDRSHFKTFGDSALVFESVYYMTVPDHGAYMDTQQAINLRLYEGFEAEGLEFAYPTQTLFVRADWEPSADGWSADQPSGRSPGSGHARRASGARAPSP
jgi:small-conductance mechanosensitive channel